MERVSRDRAVVALPGHPIAAPGSHLVGLGVDSALDRSHPARMPPGELSQELVGNGDVGRQAANRRCFHARLEPANPRVGWVRIGHIDHVIEAENHAPSKAE